MKILLTGGAGYIGAVTSELLQKSGHQILVFDHFQSHPPAKLGSIPWVKGDLLLPDTLGPALKDFQPDVVMHMAAYIQMAESVANPTKYFENNVEGTRNLLDAMVHHGIKRLVFASSAGVYGDPLQIPIPENAPKQPKNPYGQTKLDCENMLLEYDRRHGLHSHSIRFFNAAGATPTFGEDHHDESHIIPNIFAALRANTEFSLFGKDYPTPDGTCVRDYIHVTDLAQAFAISAQALVEGATTTAYNAGTGAGYSNKQIVAMVEQISGQQVNVRYHPRRPGDAAELVADVSRIKSELGWEPKNSDLQSIVQTAYEYHIHH